MYVFYPVTPKLSIFDSRRNWSKRRSRPFEYVIREHASIRNYYIQGIFKYNNIQSTLPMDALYVEIDRNVSRETINSEWSNQD